MKKCIFKKEEVYVNDINFEKLMIIYSIALEKVKLLLVSLKEQINEKSEYDVIEKVVSRIKEPNSILDKMIKKGYSLTYKTLIEKINDIAGARIICNSEEDVYKIVGEIKRLENIRILKSKDYIKNPKESGYSAYHIVVEVPIFRETQIVWVKVEVQIRTLTMDYWANIEHDISYKRNKKSIKKRLEV